MGCGGGFGRMGGMGGIGRGLARGWLGGRQMQNPDEDPYRSARRDDEPEAILRARLARGEITIEEYRALRDALKETAL